MKGFDLVLPRSLDEALGALPHEDTREQRGRVKVLAGGQDLLGEMKEHLAEPELLVSLGRVPGLDGVEAPEGGGLELGALVTLDRLEGGDVAKRWPMLAEAATSIASPQIRSVGTVGGNLCQRPRCWYYRTEHARCLKKGGDTCFAALGMSKYNAVLGGGPSYIVHPSDLAPALVAYDAMVTLRGPKGERSLALRDFFTLPSQGDVTRENVLAPDELVTRVSIPAGKDGWSATFLKMRERSSFDFALSSVALALRLVGGKIAEARLVLGGVAPVPWRCASAEELLVGRAIDDETCRRAGEEALRGAEPLEHNAYKVPMTRGLITKALRKLGG